MENSEKVERQMAEWFGEVYINPHLKNKMTTQERIEKLIYEANVDFKMYIDFKANAEWRYEELADQADTTIWALKTIIDELSDAIKILK